MHIRKYFFMFFHIFATIIKVFIIWSNPTKPQRLPPLQNYFLPWCSLWCVINEYFYLKRKWCFDLKISRFFWFCVIHRSQNLWRHHRHCFTMEVTLTLTNIKLKFGQILVCCMTNISSMLLVQSWRLETSSRAFYEFIKTKI